MRKGNYHYFLPQKNLALTPSSPRDASRLFVYETEGDKIYFDRFYHLSKYLPKESFLVLNNTKVLPAKVLMKKQTGGKVIVLFLINEIKKKTVPVLVDRQIRVGEKIFFDEKNYLEVGKQKEKIFSLRFSFPKEKLFYFLKKYGTMPTPLYLKKSPLKKEELFKKYQTIFAQKEGSSAAPTASLHFTRRVFNTLEKKGIEKYFITLHVGLGTFAPITEENLKLKKLHEEYYEISEKTLHYINIMKSKGKKLVAVGTTVVRALESIKKLKKLFGETDLFIFPPFDFKMVDILITNFHLPNSSLMMLVEAFLQHKKARRSLVDLYNIAIANNFRFYSFGDAMLIL